MDDKIIAGVVKGVLDPLTTGINTHIDRKFAQTENEKQRDFIKLEKNKEFYKTEYSKEINKIFDYWIEVIRLTQIKDNPNLSSTEKKNLKEKYEKLLRISEISKMNTLTLKYADEETVKVLATNNYLFNNKDEHKKYTSLYAYIKLFCVLKKDILDITLNPFEVLSVYTNDIWTSENLNEYRIAKEHYEKKFEEFKMHFLND